VATLSNQQAACYLARAGWPQDLIPTMVAIGHPESGLRTDAQGPAVGPRHAVGWLQIMDFPDRTAKWNLQDPLQNAQAGLAVYQSQGLGAWSTYPQASAAFLSPVQQDLAGFDYSQCGQATLLASTSPSSGSGLLKGQATDPWGIGQGIADAVGYSGSVAGSIGQNLKDSGTLAVGLLLIAAALGLVTWIFLHETEAGQSVRKGARELGKAAAAVAVVVPK
jgi:hypothetical protein